MIQLLNRDKSGKQCKSLIREGYIPCVLFGKNAKSINAKIDHTNLKQLLELGKVATPIDVNIDKNNYKIIIRSIEKHPVTDEVRHINLMIVDEKSPITVPIPFKITGISPAVKNGWGVLMRASDYVWIKAISSQIPPYYEIDISKLEKLGQNISVKDLKLGEGIKLVNNQELNKTIVTIASFQKRIEETTEVATTEEQTETEGATTEAE